MASKTLTPKQQQIKELADGGATVREAAKKVGITENGIYQHSKRIREEHGIKIEWASARSAAKPSAAKSTSGRRRSAAAKSTPARSSGRASTRSRTRPVITDTPAPEPTTRASADPLEVISQRREQIEEELAGIAERRAELRLALDNLHRDETRLNEERERLAFAERALRGEVAEPPQDPSEGVDEPQEGQDEPQEGDQEDSPDVEGETEGEHSEEQALAAA